MGPWGRRVGTWWGRGDVPILVRLGPGEPSLRTERHRESNPGPLDPTEGHSPNWANRPAMLKRVEKKTEISKFPRGPADLLTAFDTPETPVKSLQIAL